MRKGAHEAVNKVVASGLNEYQLSEALGLARSGLRNPSAWDGYLRRAAASLMLTSLYGERPASLLLTMKTDVLLIIITATSSRTSETLVFFTSTHSTNISRFLSRLERIGYVIRE